MGKSDIEIAVLRHRKARIRELRHKQLLDAAAVSPPEAISYTSEGIYMAATEGNIGAFAQLLFVRGVIVLRETTPQGNTVLHLAAIYGRLQLVMNIIHHEQNLIEHPNAMPNNYQRLLLRPNSNGDLPLHVAAAAGHEAVVIVLIQSLLQLPHTMQILLGEGRQFGVRDVWVVQNNEGNTVLHLALKANNEDVVRRFVEADQRVSFIPNEERASPLYMASEAGNVLLVNEMLQSRVARFEGKSVIHAAIKSKSKGILNLLLEDPIHRNLINSRDEEKRNLLSHAASVGYDEGVHFLLVEFRDIAYVRDPDGFFPIHSACRKGHLGALQAILQVCSDTIELLNLHGQNILHIAAGCGKNEVVKFILGNKMYSDLINQKDHKGNTPLHLAAMFWYPKMHTLTNDVRIKLGELNKSGFTALDAAEECMELNPTFRERLTWMALVCVGAPRALKLMPYDPFLAHGPQEGIIQSSEMPSAKKYKDRVNTLLLLAILVATMAFSAAFSVTKVPDEKTKHWHNPVALQVFVVFNTIAMYSAVLTTVALIWAQLGDLVLILNVFKVVLPLLGFALISMSFAFLAGMFAVVGNQCWLLALLIASGSVFLVMLFLVVVPFICPYTSISPPLFRYVFRYPFRLLMLIVWNDTDDDLE